MSAPSANFHGFHLRKWFEFKEETLATETGALADGEPLVKYVLAVAVHNPYAGRFCESLQKAVDDSKHLGEEFARRIKAYFAGGRVESYGKAALVGSNGEYEHGNALLTTVFADPVRAAVGGGKAWIPSTGKRAAPGAPIDIPLAHKDALYVRSHYDTITVSFSDAPAPDEIVIAFAVATRGRLRARLGGIKSSEIEGKDGLK